MDLINTRCTQGKLIITEHVIKIQLGGLKEQTLSRESLTGIDSKVAVPSLFGKGGGTNLVFHGTGGDLHAGLVNPKVVKEIKTLLGM